MKVRILSVCILSILITLSMFPVSMKAQALKENPALDEKVKKFLSDHSGQWYDMNVPAADGQITL